MSDKNIPVNRGEARDALLLNGALKTGAGFVVAGAVSLLAFRGSCGRMFLTGLGTGIGAGIAYQEANEYYRSPSTHPLPNTRSVQDVVNKSGNEVYRVFKGAYDRIPEGWKPK
eukprot:GDKI01044690.1.p1 GENE.GDKI01044690.1~~GDKI01044690.1.p1  ORF type:complete len:113 (-),score=32.55 GDKI01044690.1:261-599(-)